MYKRCDRCKTFFEPYRVTDWTTHQEENCLAVKRETCPECEEQLRRFYEGKAVEAVVVQGQ